LANSAAGIARRIDVPPNVRYLEKSERDANIMECPLLTHFDISAGSRCCGAH
jgi:hypothetical protein